MKTKYFGGVVSRIQQSALRKNLVSAGLSFFLLGAAIDAASGTQIVSQLTPETSVSAGGGGDSSHPIISSDGRYVLFSSTANNLVVGPGGQEMQDYVPAKENVFLRDRQAGTTILASVNAAGTGGGNGDSWPCAISTNGQYALFESAASDLISGDTNGAKDIFLRDILHGTTTLVSVSTNGTSGNGESREAAMTPDGRYVAFVSAASNLVAIDSNAIADIFVRDVQLGSTVLASPGAAAVSPGSATPFTQQSSSEWPIISVDGRYVAFYSTATNIVAGQPAGSVFVRDLSQGVTLCASTNAQKINPSSASPNYAMSTNGQFIAYQATGGSRAGVVFLYNVATAGTQTIFTNGAVPASLDLDARNIDISPDGNFVVFTVSNGPAANSSTSVMLWSALSNTTSLVSGGTAGGQADFPRIDQSGRYVAFFDNEASLTTNSDGNFHVYLRDTLIGSVQLVDVSTNGTTPISSLTTPFHFSANGNVVAFECPDGAMSSAPNKLDVFARDLVSNTIEIISTPAQALATSTAFGPSRLLKNPQNILN
jgi:Tol biopolymer transport system component